jgi:hypothetical protein
MQPFVAVSCLQFALAGKYMPVDHALWKFFEMLHFPGERKKHIYSFVLQLIYYVCSR